MSQNVGVIYYEVESDTSKLVNSTAAVDTSLDKMGKQFARTDKAANQAQFQMTKTAAAVRDLGKESTSTTSIMGKLSGVMAGLLTLRGVTGLIQMAEAYNEMAERITMATASQEEYNLVQTRLLSTASKTYRAMSEGQELFIRTAAGLKAMGYSTEQVLDVTDSLSFAFVKNATSVDRAKSATDAFTKVINKGKVEADAWETILAAVPTVIADIAAATGKSEAEIRQLGVSGGVSARMLSEGLRQSLDENAKAADGMATTVRDATTRLMTNLAAYVGEANRANGATGILSSGILVLAENIDVLVKALLAVGAGVMAKYIASLGVSLAAQLKSALAAREAAAAELRLAEAQAVGARAALARAQATVGLSTATAVAARATDTLTAAEGRLAIAKKAATAAGTSFLSILGGPAGIIALVASAAAGIFLFGSNASNAAVDVNALTASIDKLGVAQLRQRRQQADEAIEKLKKQAKDASVATGALEKDLSALTDMMVRGRGVEAEGVANVEKSLVDQRAEQEKANEELAAALEAHQKITSELEKREGLGSSPAPVASTADPEVAKRLQSLRDEAELAKLTGVARARLAAIQKLGANATAEERAEAERLATSIYNLETAQKSSASAGKKAATERAQAQKENIKVQDDLLQSLVEVGMRGEELAATKAKASLNKFATPEEVQNVEALARALYRAQQIPVINPNKQLLGQVDPIAGAQIDFKTQIDQLRALNEAKLLEDQRYLELKTQAEKSYDERSKQLQEENFRRQSSWNNLLMSSLDRLGDAATDSVVGLVTGANNGKDAIRSLAGAILKDGVGSLVEMGIQYVKNLVMGKAAGTAATAFGVAQAAVLAAAWAPAAAMASLASFGANAAPAGAALASTTAIASGLALSGGRQYGGPVAPGGMHRINENGKPEILNTANGQQYLLPNTRGQVVSNRDATSGKSEARVTVVVNNAPAGTTVEQRSGADGERIIQVVIADIRSGGEMSQAMERTYGMNRRGN